ncbi:hypothetical protein AB0A77_28235 [Streptomyces varsoviensis]|uniref:hypothetical protein n=1 Tax=Streptomyces varsoviensis TaxID=67373 RepID=UPI0033C1CC08
MTSPEQATTVAVELERLRGAVDTGFATLNGRLDVALQRTATVETRIADLEQRVTTLEHGRWPLPTIGVLTGLAGAATAVVALFQR